MVPSTSALSTRRPAGSKLAVIASAVIAQDHERLRLARGSQTRTVPSGARADDAAPVGPEGDRLHRALVAAHHHSARGPRPSRVARSRPHLRSPPSAHPG